MTVTDVLSSERRCLMCSYRTTINTYERGHEHSEMMMQADLLTIRSLASRLLVGIHTDDIEKKLLRFDRFLFLYSKANMTFVLVGKNVDRNSSTTSVFTRKSAIYSA